jgi:Zinc carboxypeptidase
MSIPRRRRLALIAPMLMIALTARGRGQVAPPPSLETIWTDGTLVRDQNGDGVIDAVPASIVLPETPSPDELAAAADVAARLGHETMAMNLPMTPAADGGLIAIGPAASAGAGVIADSARLQKGQGTVTVAVVNGRAVVSVAGADGAGTRAAADAFAGLLPFAGDPKGPTLSEVIRDVQKILGDAGISAVPLHATTVVATSGRDGLDRIRLRGTLRAADLLKAQRALNGLRPVPAGAKPALTYPGARALEIRLDTPGVAPTVVTVAQVPATADPEPPARRPGAAAKEAVDLSSLYASTGLLGDSDSNLIPDRVDTLISVDGPGTRRTIDVAARLGLESTGISLPLVVPPASLGKPDSQPTLVLIGSTHPVVQQLEKDGKLPPLALGPGEGAIRVVKKAFGEKPAVVVTGGDAAGIDRALEQLAERLPHIWDRGKDRTTLDEVEEDTRRFLAGRSPAGQAALALYKLRQVAGELRDVPLQSARVEVSVDHADPGLAALLTREAAAALRLPSVEVAVENRDVQKASTIFQDDFEIPSEVDDLRARVRDTVIPALAKRPKGPVSIEARLSEPTAVRRSLEREIRAELTKAGVADPTVTVLSAYKQGYSWIDEVVKPAVAGKPIDRITIRFAENGPPDDWKQQTTFAPTRWLLELYPIAEVLARDLHIPADHVVFQQAPIKGPTYEVTVTAAGGAPLFHGTFEPKFVLRQFFDQFADYEKVRVTTGWLTARSGEATIADDRIVTDPERFWDRFQSKSLRDVYAYMMRVHKGKPRPEDAPYFGELTVDLTLSEPDEKLGIDQEHIAPLESVQEEVYFNTLHFFDLLGRYTRAADLDYPGRIIPIVRPKADGRPGHATVRFTGYSHPRPEVVVSYTPRDGTPREIRRDIPAIAVERPEALTAVVRAGQHGISRLDLRVKVDTERDERAELVRKTREEQVDRQILSAEQLSAVIGNLSTLRAAGLYRTALAYHDLGEVRVDAAWAFDPDPKATRTAVLAANGSAAPWPDIRTRLPAGYAYQGESLVQWDEPIPPDDAYAILAKMSTFKEASVYKVGESYLGREIWAMDLMPAMNATHWSAAKATTLKPTVIYSARQHANEVSSTSHTLKLAERLLTDPEERKKLNSVNAVFHPITNPDGAQLAFDLQKITPDYMLHPGYLGSLGVDATNGGWDPDPIYPESKVRPALWRAWLPDIFLNPHGYPTHEWVQLFSEYAAWIRTRIGESRDYWTMRGWWMPGFGYVDDPKYPRNKAAQFDLRAFVAARMNGAPEVKALNDRAYARYERYTTAFDRTLFKVNFTDGVLIYSSIKGAKATPASPNFMVRQPNITIFDGSTEAPDETAHGDWMKLVATAGLTWDTAMMDWLIAQPHKVERTGAGFAGGVSLTMNRPRPPKPLKEKDARSTADTAERDR